jgi:hypothetical protein
MGIVSTGGCNTAGSTDGATPSPQGGSPNTAARSGLPSVASAVPQPDPVAATLGGTATVTGRDLFGKKSATVEVTLSKPEVITEVKLKTGAVQRPKKEVFVVFDIVIEGVDGTYDFSPLHFHLIPKAEVAGWRGKPRVGLQENADEPVPISDLGSISFGSISAGDRISGKLVFDQPRSALNGAAIVLRSLLVPDGPAAAHWSLD